MLVSMSKNQNSKPTLRPIVTLATTTVLNDKTESVLIPKVLCTNEELKHISDCMACEHHKSVPNHFAVECLRTDDDKKNERK